MNRKIARWLRKWADLIDPKTPPSDPLVISISVNTTEFDDAMQRVSDALDNFSEKAGKSPISLSSMIEREIASGNAENFLSAIRQAR